MIRQPTATWTANQERVAVMLASGKGIKAAAEECEVGERTVHTWLDNSEYRALIASLRSRMLNEVVGRLTDAMCGAADVLRSLLNDEAPNIRLRAATAILDSMLKLREHVELSERLSELENRLDGKPEISNRSA